jgi:predicted N-acetyltransferase YhbS
VVTIQSAGSDYPTLSLGPIAVLPKYQKEGIGGMLINTGHKKALELGYMSVVLLGHPSYYPRFGYRMAAIWGLTNPWGIHTEAFMAIELVKGSLDEKAGLVVYPKAFNQAA